MNKLLIKIADMLNGNAKRRRAIKQRLTVAMMQTEHHSITAARVVNVRKVGGISCNHMLHWRADFHRNAV
jgi:hypothetical protein